MMENTDWDSVLQFVSEPMDMEFSDRPIAERTDRNKLSLPSGEPQIPLTPPDSSVGSPGDDSKEADTLVSVSTTFYPGAPHNSHPADLVLLSKDSVFFYVHLSTLLKASHNNFNHLLPPPNQQDKDQSGPIITIPESSIILNIILHAVYDMTCAHYSPSFDALSAAVSSFQTFGIPIHERIARNTHMYTLLMAHAPLCPLDLYALAASYDLYDLAVAASSHLLSMTLAMLTDEMAERIGPIYVKRLFFLHFGRAEALKRLLLSPPHPHAPTPWCDFMEQKKLTRAWALASAYLAWDARPDLSTSTMESALSPLGEHLSCDLCRDALKDRIRNLVIQWSVVKRTI